MRTVYCLLSIGPGVGCRGPDSSRLPLAPCWRGRKLCTGKRTPGTYTPAPTPARPGRRGRRRLPAAPRRRQPHRLPPLHRPRQTPALALLHPLPPGGERRRGHHLLPTLAGRTNLPTYHLPIYRSPIYQSPPPPTQAVLIFRLLTPRPQPLRNLFLGQSSASQQHSWTERDVAGKQQKIPPLQSRGDSFKSRHPKPCLPPPSRPPSPTPAPGTPTGPPPLRSTWRSACPARGPPWSRCGSTSAPLPPGPSAAPPRT